MVYPKFVCPSCDREYHAIVNPVSCSQCGGTLLVEDDDVEPDIPLAVWYWSQRQKERAFEAQAAAIIQGFEQLLGETDDGSQDKEEDLP